uniref:Serpin domain-containing protein n=1 Tax=Romanomermis culicivorax TaxID=13658 RepID=A0A915IUF2_ROMCU
MLINALYFKAPWSVQFPDYNTEKKIFHISPTDQIDVDMMSMDEKEMWFENEDIQLLQLPYTGVFASMVLILPKKRYGLKKVLQDLNSKDLLQWLDNSRKEKVQ